VALVIAEAEIRRLAAQSGVDAMVQDLDYALGWFLVGLLRQPGIADQALFKGGTCLRKCYFPDYRFSEDLDFTLRRRVDIGELQAAVEAARGWSQENGGPDFGAAPARFEVVNDEYGQESLQVRVYYRGPLQFSGPARAIQMDLSRGESVVFAPETRTLLHTYSDVRLLGQIEVACYSLPEMLAEKIRAISGQRRFAVSRDLYDIYQLSRQGIDTVAVRTALPAKFAAKGMDIAGFSMDRLLDRREAMQTDWHRRLVHLFQAGQLIEFDKAWQVAFDFVRGVMSAPLDNRSDA
jgi:predicted nucleotidyltransferase component of viral defense system